MRPDKLLVARHYSDLKVKADPFRRTDVHYTTVTWTNPITGQEQALSVPVEFLVTFFGLVGGNMEEQEDFEQRRKEWLIRAGRELEKEGYGG